MPGGADTSADRAPPPVHVVGNGPLTPGQERALLSPARAGPVWGFNDLKGMPDGMAPDVLVLRWHHGEYPLPPAGMWISGSHRRVLRVEGPCQPPDPAGCIRLRNLTLFPGCNRTDPASLQDVRDNPSSGAIALGLLQSAADVSRVNVYGMNFQFQFGLAHSRHEKRVVTDCCTKCRFHPTASPAYFPLRHAHPGWLLQAMGMYLIPCGIVGAGLCCMTWASIAVLRRVRRSRRGSPRGARFDGV